MTADELGRTAVKRVKKGVVAKKQLTVYSNGTPQVTAARHSSERATGIQGTGEHSVTTEDYCGLPNMTHTVGRKSGLLACLGVETCLYPFCWTPIPVKPASKRHC
jgi:hypothetical protein